MTQTQRKGVSIGLVVALVTILGGLLGWVGSTFAHGQEYGRLQGDVVKNAEDIKDLNIDIRELRIEIRSGFDRLSDKLDDRTFVRPGGFQ